MLAILLDGDLLDAIKIAHDVIPFGVKAEGRIGGRRRKLDATKQREIAESVITGRKSGADMARRYIVSQSTVSRIVAAQRVQPELSENS
jgi:hypothetical protein